MNVIDIPVAPLAAEAVPEQTKKTNYPPPFAALVQGRVKRRLGEAFGLKNFGVNQNLLAPGAISALQHRHSRQDEFVYILAGRPLLRLGEREYRLHPGECCGFPAGGEAHQLVNDTQEPVSYLEIGDRSLGDEVEYPHDDLKASLRADGSWAMTRKDGSEY